MNAADRFPECRPAARALVKAMGFKGSNPSLVDAVEVNIGLRLRLGYLSREPTIEATRWLTPSAALALLNCRNADLFAMVPA